MSRLDVIGYKGIKYPIRYATVNGEDISVSTEALEQVLYNDRVGYTAPEAKQIDERIYCYVEDFVIHGMEQSEFERYIKDHFF